MKDRKAAGKAVWKRPTHRGRFIAAVALVGAVVNAGSALSRQVDFWFAYAVAGAAMGGAIAAVLVAGDWLLGKMR